MRFPGGLTGPGLMGGIAATAVIVLWLGLRHDHQARVADIVENLSYASRSELARQLILQYRAFEQLGGFWAEYSNIPPDQWEADAMIELDHFAGLDLVAFSQRDGPQFLSRGPNVALARMPTDDEWTEIEQWVDEAHSVTSPTVTEPRRDPDGNARMRIYWPAQRAGNGGVVIAVLDVTSQIGAILEDNAPGYDVVATCCDDFELYREGDFTADIPEEWSQGGLIEPLDGELWSVVLSPSAELAADFRPWAINSVLVVGLGLAFAIGAIRFHSQRADARAAEATAARRKIGRMNRDLEERVRLRTRELDEALTDLNTISLSVAHDVRTPLNTLGLSTEILRRELTETGADPSALTRIDSARAQLSGILDRLLELSRASTFSLNREWIPVRSLVRDIIDDLPDGEPVLSEIEESDSAFADPTALKIVFLNLIQNALHHGRSEEPIEVGSRSSGTESVYYVRDHGPGIDASRAQELFAATGTKDRQPGAGAGGGPGLGIGLAIAHRVVTRLGGRIAVEPTDGGGATFVISLPKPAASD